MLPMWLYNTYMFLLLFRSKIFAGKDIDKRNDLGGRDARASMPTARRGRDAEVYTVMKREKRNTSFPKEL